MITGSSSSLLDVPFRRDSGLEGFERAYQRRLPQSFVSLMYHNVTAPRAMFPRLSPSITSYFVDRSTFERHMSMVSELAEPVGLSDIRNMERDSWQGRVTEFDRIGVQVTFDDGWSGSVDEAGPVLESFGLQGHLFVTTGLIGRPGFLTGHELQNIPKSTFAICSHARSHRLLSRLSTAEVSDELQTSKKILEDLLGTEVDTLSLPGGAMDDRVLRIARQSGHRFVFTSDVHLNSAGTLSASIGRVAVRSATTDGEIRRWVSGRLVRERLRHLTLSMSRRLLGWSRYDRIRRCLLGEARCHNEMVDLSTAPPVNRIANAVRRARSQPASAGWNRPPRHDNYAHAVHDRPEACFQTAGQTCEAQ